MLGKIFCCLGGNALLNIFANLINFSLYAGLIVKVLLFLRFLSVSTSSRAVRIANSSFDKVGMVLKLGKKLAVCAVVKPFVDGTKNLKQR